MIIPMDLVRSQELTKKFKFSLLLYFPRRLNYKVNSPGFDHPSFKKAVTTTHTVGESDLSVPEIKPHRLMIHPLCLDLRDQQDRTKRSW